MTQPSPVLTRREAIRYLRIDEDHREFQDQVRALYRLIRERGLVALRYSKSYKFHVDDLETFLKTGGRRDGGTLGNRPSDGQAAEESARCTPKGHLANGEGGLT